MSENTPTSAPQIPEGNGPPEAFLSPQRTTSWEGDEFQTPPSFIDETQNQDQANLNEKEDEVSEDVEKEMYFEGEIGTHDTEKGDSLKEQEQALLNEKKDEVFEDGDFQSNNASPELLVIKVEKTQSNDIPNEKKDEAVIGYAEASKISSEATGPENLVEESENHTDLNEKTEEVFVGDAQTSNANVSAEATDPTSNVAYSSQTRPEKPPRKNSGESLKTGQADLSQKASSDGPNADNSKLSNDNDTAQQELTGSIGQSRPLSRVLSRPSSFGDFRAVASGFSGRQWVTLIVFGFADLFCAMVLALQSPFYPPEAERKGASATEYGLVFGIYEFVVLVTSPIFGKYMNRIGPRLIFNAGITTTALSCIAFGFLDKINDHYWFIGLSFLFRITEALGASAFVTSSFTILAYEFPDSVATVFASLETFYGLGLIIGPSLGGALFQLGGFSLPFAATGVCLFITSIAATIVMPKIEPQENSGGNCADGYGIFTVLKIPAVAVSAIALMTTANSIGFLSATLEPHLRQFDLSPLQMGLMFIIYGGVYAFTAPILGWICDKTAKPIWMILIGVILVFTAFLFIGPASFLPIQTTLWLSGLGLVILGLGLSSILVAGFITALTATMDNGFPDSIATYGVISGLWTSAVSFGSFVGPSVGGFLLDHYSFRPSTYYILVTEIVVMLMVATYLFHRQKFSKGERHSNSERSPLLTSSQNADQIGNSDVHLGYGAV